MPRSARLRRDPERRVQHGSFEEENLKMSRWGERRAGPERVSRLTFDSGCSSEIETLKKVQEANDSLAAMGRMDCYYCMWDANRIQLLRSDSMGREEVIKTVTLAQLQSESAKLRQQRGTRGTHSSGGGASPPAALQTEIEEEEEEVSAPLSIQEEYRRKLAALSNNCNTLADSTRRLRYSRV